MSKKFVSKSVFAFGIVTAFAFLNMGCKERNFYSNPTKGSKIRSLEGPVVLQWDTYLECSVGAVSRSIGMAGDTESATIKCAGFCDGTDYGEFDLGIFDNTPLIAVDVAADKEKVTLLQPEKTFSEYYVPKLSSAEMSRLQKGNPSIAKGAKITDGFGGKDHLIYLPTGTVVLAEPGNPDSKGTLECGGKPLSSAKRTADLAKKLNQSVPREWLTK